MQRDIALEVILPNFLDAGEGMYSGLLALWLDMLQTMKIVLVRSPEYSYTEETTKMFLLE